MSIFEAVRMSYAKYADFEGSASRSEYWLFWLFRLLVDLLVWFITLTTVTVGFVGGIAALSTENANDLLATQGAGIILVILWIMYSLYSLATFVPALASGSRRLHEAGFSGWLQLVVLVPIVGAIAMIVLAARPPKYDGNRYSGNSARAVSARRDDYSSYSSSANSEDWI